MIPQDMQPPPLTVIAHGKLPFHVMFNFIRRCLEFKIVQSLRRAPQPVFLTRPLASPSVRFSVGRCVSLLLEASETPMSRLRNFDTKPPSSYCYEFRSDNRLESVANVHTAADLHARPVP